MPTAEELIRQLNLSPHPEGGYYRETYRSNGQISEESLPENMSGSRNYATCIYFLLTTDKASAFHRINQDEIWHFYQGSPIRLHQISPEGAYQQIIIGPDLAKGHHLQYVVPATYWFAAEVMEGAADYALAGCTVAPGFDFKDFVLPKREELIAQFPQHAAVITRLTHA